MSPKPAPTPAVPGVVWWRGELGIDAEHYTIGHPTPFPNVESPEPGLMALRGGILVLTALYTVSVDLTVIAVDATTDLSGLSDLPTVAVQAPIRGWRLRADYDDVPEAPSPLLGSGSWEVTVIQNDIDPDTFVTPHTLYLRPLDASATAFADRRTRAVQAKAQADASRPAPDPVPPGREPWGGFRRLPTGTYRVGVRRGSGAPGDPCTLDDSETIVHERVAEWNLYVTTDLELNLGEKWRLAHTWYLAAGDELVALTENGLVPRRLRDPIAAGPATAWLLTRLYDVGDIVRTDDGKTHWAYPTTDEIRIKAVLRDTEEP